MAEVPKTINAHEREIFRKLLDYIRLMRRMQTISLGNKSPHHWTMHDTKSIVVSKNNLLSKKMALKLLETLNYHNRDIMFTPSEDEFFYNTFNIYTNDKLRPKKYTVELDHYQKILDNTEASQQQKDIAREFKDKLERMKIPMIQSPKKYHRIKQEIKTP